MKVTVNAGMSDIPCADWNQLGGDRFPFLRHEFLDAAERSGCVAAETGWSPRHLTIEGNGQLRAAMPLYEKSHSWGEFVFDWAWANAYEQAGLRYYPKLVSAIPFTPAPCNKILLRDPDDTEAAAALLQAASTLAIETDCSSFHVLFPAKEDIAFLETADLLIRKDCQFHWHNNGYRSFDDFLATFTSAKRKKARRDRRRVHENGIQFRRIQGSELDTKTWSIVFKLISRTFLIRGNAPYFSEDFFNTVSNAVPEAFLVVLAEVDSEPVAAAVFLQSDERLYGRYWGSNGHYDALHFETCYYQGIDYCIEKGLQVFEPGTQGEHKISRGFSPIATWSAHWLAHPEFANAIEAYLSEEEKRIDRYIDAVDAHLPYRNAEARKKP